jgi:hypothetical protein
MGAGLSGSQKALPLVPIMLQGAVLCPIMSPLIGHTMTPLPIVVIVIVVVIVAALR